MTPSPITLPKLGVIRRSALWKHQSWKNTITLADNITSDQWEIAWDDGTVDASDPLVENIYSQALEDKVMTAGSILPKMFVPPRRGTKADRAETNAQTRRRAMMSYWDRSRLRRDIEDYYSDHLHAGALYTHPWVNWQTDVDAARFPFIMRLDPRFMYPISHNSQGDLTSAAIMRQRTVADIESDWSYDPVAMQALYEIRDARSRRDGSDTLKYVEEIWFMDEYQWAVAFVDTMLPKEYQGVSYVPTASMLPNQGSSLLSRWAHPPEAHRLFGCPISEAKRKTADGTYRGGLVDTIPRLKVAQNFMARMLDDLNMSVYAPVLLENIENPEEYAPGGILIGTGEGKAKVEYARPPVNFEAQRVVQGIIEDARRQAFEPQQRAGESGAAINSGKGTMALMGSFNAELASSQKAIEVLLERSTAITACFDEKWCSGMKQIAGWDERGSAYEERYDPSTLFNGDYRVRVSYGDRTGLDEQSYLTRLGTVKQLGGMSLRTFIEKSGVVDDALQEERDMAIENLTNLWLGKILPSQIEQGDLKGLVDFVDAIDTDKISVRAAVLDALKKVMGPQPGVGQGQPGQGGQNPIDVLKMARSMAFGGVPGTAQGLPAPSPGLGQVLPSQVQRRINETQPGGTALPAGG